MGAMEGCEIVVREYLGEVSGVNQMKKSGKGK
jgi:hypothetical protein